MMHSINPIISAAVASVLLVSSALAGSLDDLAERADEVDRLLSELAQPGDPTWAATEQRITRLWSQSGSDTIDLLFSRGMAALEAENYSSAIEHFTAVTDHAPDFAEGWHNRSIVFFRIEEYGLALRDIERALALNPNHFGALTGVGIIYEQLGEYDLALKALLLARDLNPNRESIHEAIERLEAATGSSRL